jgi:hypothetical protein
MFMFFAVSACNSQSSVRSDIGSENDLPPAQAYPDEVISITLWKRDGEPTDQVSITIEPDRRISLLKYAIDRPEGDIVVATQVLDTKRLDQDLFKEIRARFANYRPVELDRVGSIILPKGCGFIHDGRGIVNIQFNDDQDRSGSFLLQKGCDTASATRITSDLQDILDKLPNLKGEEGYGWSSL